MEAEPRRRHDRDDGVPGKDDKYGEAQYLQQRVYAHVVSRMIPGVLPIRIRPPLCPYIRESIEECVCSGEGDVYDGHPVPDCSDVVPIDSARFLPVRRFGCSID